MRAVDFQIALERSFEFFPDRTGHRLHARPIQSMMHEQQRDQRYWQRSEKIYYGAIAREEDHPEKGHRELHPDD